jgi:hypothetical protein
MKVGDLVRFKDISSRCQHGERMFPEMDGRTGLVLRVVVDDLSGEVMIHTDLEQRCYPDTRGRGFNSRYYEVINGNR